MSYNLCIFLFTNIKYWAMNHLEGLRSDQVLQERAYFINLVAVALADGFITHEEYDRLYMLAKRFHATHDEVDAIIASQQTIVFQAPVSERDKLMHFIGLIRMMWVDGVMDASEHKIIQSFGNRLGFDESRIERYIHLISSMILDGYVDHEIYASLTDAP